MLRDIYLRPLGLYPARQGEASREVWGGLRLADGWLDFTALEVIERNGAAIERRIGAIGELMERDWGRRTWQAADMLELIRAPRGRFAAAPRIMGILNVTPDSFSDGGRNATIEAALAHGARLIAEGADILDVGGESTRPGAEPVAVEEELRRVLPVIEHFATAGDTPVSIDTRHARVMREAARAGAAIINDVSALGHDPASLETAADLGLPVVLMHAKGDPRTMQDDPRYDDVLLDVFDYLEARIEAAMRAGIPRTKLIADPGIGFGKSVAHNLALMAGLSLFHGLGVPLLVGASRKRFIGAINGLASPADRIHGSVAAALAAVAQGAQIVRVHDVAATRQALDVWLAATAGETGSTPSPS